MTEPTNSSEEQLPDEAEVTPSAKVRAEQAESATSEETREVGFDSDEPARDDSFLSKIVAHPHFARFSIAALLLVTILVFLPYVRSMVSRNAVVTAFVYESRAPIPGVIEDLEAKAGVVLEQTHGGWVKDPRVDDELLSELRARNDAQRNLVQRLEEQRSELSRIEARERDTRKLYRDALERDVERRTGAVGAEIMGLEARRDELREDARRARALHGAEVVSESALESAEAAFSSVQADLESRKALLVRLEMAQKELSEDRLIVEGLDAPVQIDADLRGLQVELMGLDRSRAEAEAELATTVERLERAEERFGYSSRAALSAPAGALVWQASTLEGQFVEAGDPVFTFVDCNDLLLDLRFDDSVLSMVEVGHPVRFRLFGSRRWHEAEVVLVRGSGATMGADSLATHAERSSRNGQVLAKILPEEPFGSSEAFCGIGRKAFAKVKGIGMFDEFLRRLFL